MLVALAVIVASLFEILPTFLIGGNVPTIATVKPYTPLELYGRDIYLREGCYNCHSQMVRPFIDETVRYGMNGKPAEYSKPGEFVYDHPFQWGSKRTGPDLAREGGRRDELWHLRHFENPRATLAGLGDAELPAPARRRHPVGRHPVARRCDGDARRAVRRQAARATRRRWRSTRRQHFARRARAPRAARRGWRTRRSSR